MNPHDLDVSWSNSRERLPQNSPLQTLLAFVAAIVVMWFFIGLISLGQAASGDPVYYVNWLHGPWRWLFQLLGLLP